MTVERKTLSVQDLEAKERGQKKILIGIDIGGTKTSYYVMSDDLATLKHRRFSTQKLGGGSLKLLDKLILMVHREGVENVKRIGISINAAVQNNTILKSSALGVENFPLEDYMGKELNVPIYVENDVVAQAKAECQLGYGKRYKSFAVLNIGTGTRVCYCQDGTVVTGNRNMGGEVSQLKVYTREFDKHFLLDELISGRGISNIYRELTDQDKSARDIFNAQSDPAALQTIGIFKRYLVYLFEAISYFYNPEAVIVNGSVFKSAQLFLKEVTDSFYESNFDFFKFNVHRSQLKNANVLGVLG